MTQAEIAPAQETTTALAVRGQLEEARERLAKAEKKWDGGGVGATPGIAGAGAVVAGIVTVLVCAPVGVVLMAGGLTSFVIGLRIGGEAERNLAAAATTVTILQEKERAAKQARCQALRLAAESVLTKAAGAYEIEQELRVEVADETPKALQIVGIGTELDDEGQKVQKISARLYETVTQPDGGLKHGEHIVNIQGFTCPLPLNSDPAPPHRGETEKRLPPCTPTPA